MVGNLLLRGMLVGVIAGLLGILRLKSALRLEWRSQDAQHKEDQRYHAARIADSLTPPTRMRFPAHTASTKSAPQGAREGTQGGQNGVTGARSPTRAGTAVAAIFRGSGA